MNDKSIKERSHLGGSSLQNPIRRTFKCIKNKVLFLLAKLKSSVKSILSFLSSNEFTRETSAKNEKYSASLRGRGGARAFWRTTIFVSLALTACSAMNGFTPFDPFLRELGFSIIDMDSHKYFWVWLLIGLLGTVFFNLIVGRKQEMKGYSVWTYCCSIALGAVFLNISQIVFSVIQA